MSKTFFVENVGQNYIAFPLLKLYINTKKDMSETQLLQKNFHTPSKLKSKNILKYHAKLCLQFKLKLKNLGVKRISLLLNLQ